MVRLLKWLKTKRQLELVHLDVKKPACEPKKEWWIYVFMLQSVMELCNKYMIELQGKQLLMTTQKQVLERLRECLRVHGQVQNSMASMIFDGAAQAGGFSMSYVSAKSSF